MMVFTTPASKNAALEALTRFLIGCSLSLLLAGASAAAATEIVQLRTERTDDGVYLSALLQFDLPVVVEDALLKGVPAFFVLEADIYRDRWYWRNVRAASAARTVRLAYHPLTRRWRVSIVPGLMSGSAGLRATLSQNYETLPEALSVIQRVARWKIAESADVEQDALYALDLNFRLDLSQLPRPFQIGVAGQRDWTIAARIKNRMRLDSAVPAQPLQAAPALPASASAVSVPVAPAASAEGGK